MSNLLERLTCDEDVEPNLLLLKVKAAHIFTMEEIGDRIEENYGDLLEPLETGYYRPGEVYPVDAKKLKGLKSNKDSSLYYYNFESGRHEPNPQPAESQSLVHRKESFLLETPTVPARGIRVMAAMFEHQLDIMAPYRNSTGGLDRLRGLLKAEVDVPRFLADDLTPLVHEEILDLHKFIGDDTWYIYSTKMYGSSILIEKNVDYRVYHFHLERHNQRQSD